jgi:5-methylcytosine-specific restriction protein A
MTWESKRPGSTRAWRAVRLQVLKRDQYRCQLQYAECVGQATEVDHITNIAASNTQRAQANNPNELQAVCSPCHRAKTQREAAQARGSWRRPPERHPGLR